MSSTMSEPRLCAEMTNVVMLLFTSKVFVWIGKEANEEEKIEAVASGTPLVYKARIYPLCSNLHNYYFFN